MRTTKQSRSKARLLRFARNDGTGETDETDKIDEMDEIDSSRTAQTMFFKEGGLFLVIDPVLAPVLRVPYGLKSLL